MYKIRQKGSKSILTTQTFRDGNVMNWCSKWPEIAHNLYKL